MIVLYLANTSDELQYPLTKERDEMAQPNMEPSQVYFIQAIGGGPIKIGVSKQVRKALC